MRSLVDEVKKMWFDTLTNPETGKYSRKSVQIFFSFNFCLLSGIVTLLTDLEVPEFIFVGMLGIATGTTLFSVIDKYNTKQKSKEIPKEESPC